MNNDPKEKCRDVTNGFEERNGTAKIQGTDTKRRGNLSVCMQLIRLVKPLTGYMILAVLMGIAGHLCAAFITILGGAVLLELLGFPCVVSAGGLFVILCAAAILRGALRYGEQSCNHFIAFKLLALVREQVFKALRRLCPAKLEGRDKGNLISIITSDIELLEVFYAHTISPIAIAVLMSVIMSVFIGQYHWLLGVTALISYFVVGVCIPVFISKISGDDGIRFRSQSGELSSFVLDSLRGLPEIIQYGAGDMRLSQMNEKTKALLKEEERMKKVAGKNQAITNVVILLADLIMLFAACRLYQIGQITFAGVVIPVLALMSSFGPAVALANLGSTLQNTFAAGNRVLDILEEEPVTEEICGQEEILFSKAAAENVTFAYEDEIILDKISLEVPENSITGIQGRSGCGKSTLLKLFMRFWNVQQGNIRISGRDVGEINTRNLRDMESFVTQETHLFHDSIANNLRIAKPDASDEELETACRKASVHDFIMKLPRGYDTPVGELGDTLSGGERHRLGLARAFLHNAPLMLLDEPTSNLDSLNEAIILKSLVEERGDKTVLLVSHRESTMRIADTIYRMGEEKRNGFC